MITLNLLIILIVVLFMSLREPLQRLSANFYDKMVCVLTTGYVVFEWFKGFVINHVKSEKSRQNIKQTKKG